MSHVIVTSHAYFSFAHSDSIIYGNPDCQASEAFAKHIAASDAEPCVVPDLSLGWQDPENLPISFLYPVADKLAVRETASWQDITKVDMFALFQGSIL